MEWAGAQATIGTIAILLSLMSFGFTFYLDRQGHRRNNRIEKSQAYLGLELASIGVFKYRAAHWEALHWAQTGENPRNAPEGKLKEEADAFFYQCLNLFEVASRFRQDKVILPEIYASWVAWFFETLECAYFRQQWVAEYRDNYTVQMRAMFDPGVALAWGRDADNSLRQQFYAIVGEAIDCDQIRQWRVPVPPDPAADIVPIQTQMAPHQMAPAAPPTSAGQISFVWDDGALAQAAASFAARVIGQQPDYISHGEIQCGLATPDGAGWVDDLEARYAAEFAAPGPREMLVAQTPAGAIAGIGIFNPVLGGPVRYAIVEDMAIDPDLRGAGVGQSMLQQFDQRAADLGCAWVFLESGLGNEGAHRFFERHGFKTMSKVFGKRIEPVSEPVRSAPQPDPPSP